MKKKIKIKFEMKTTKFDWLKHYVIYAELNMFSNRRKEKSKFAQDRTEIGNFRSSKQTSTTFFMGLCVDVVDRRSAKIPAVLAELIAYNVRLSCLGRLLIILNHYSFVRL